MTLLALLIAASIITGVSVPLLVLHFTRDHTDIPTNTWDEQRQQLKRVRK
jgi:hypothetical protein